MSLENDLTRWWPARGLRARSGSMELRWIDDELLVQLAGLAAAGIHDPGQMPFSVPWSRGTAEQVARNVLSYQWAARGQVGPERLVLELAVMVDGRPVGVQAASGSDYAVLRTVETGSWLGREYQGRGVGSRMRALMLHLLFDGLGARRVNSTAYEDNAASNRVSLKTGYEPDGHDLVVRDGRAVRLQRYAMSAERFTTRRRELADLLGEPVSLSGTAAVRAHAVPGPR